MMLRLLTYSAVIIPMHFMFFFHFCTTGDLCETDLAYRAYGEQHILNKHYYNSTTKKCTMQILASDISPLIFLEKLLD